MEYFLRHKEFFVNISPIVVVESTVILLQGFFFKTFAVGMMCSDFC